MTSYATFPTLPGVTWPVHRRPTTRTIVAKHPSGGDVRTGLWQYPLYEFELAFDGLSSSANFSGLQAYSLQTLLGFYLTQGGPLTPFLFTDPDFNAAYQSGIGTGDGTTTQFPFTRTYGGMVEPVSWVTGANVYVNGVAQSGSAYSILSPNICAFATAPAAGAVLSADCNYSFLCRFLDDDPEFEQVMIGLWQAKSLKFRQVRTS